MDQVATCRLRFSNVHLLGRSVLVDAGSPGDEKGILAFLRSRAVDDLALIVLTHGHGDHAGAAAAVRRVTGAPIAVGRADSELVQQGTNGRITPQGLEARLIRRFVDFPFPAFAPDLELDAPFDLTPYGVAGRVIPAPGHTPGSLAVLTEQGEALVGDLLRGGWLGGRLAPGRPLPHYFFDDPAAMADALRRVLAQGPRVVFPGHGGPLDAGDVQRRLPTR